MTRSASNPVDVDESAIKRARISRGITVRELAKRLGVTPGAVSQMERSEAKGTIQLGTLRRALGAMGVTDEVIVVGDRPHEASYPPAPFERREDRVTYELHRAVAKKLLDDPESVRRVIPDNVAKLRAHVSGALVHDWLDRWLALRDAPIGELVDAMLATDELGKEMRQNGPFMGVLTKVERLGAIARAVR